MMENYLRVEVEKEIPRIIQPEIKVELNSPATFDQIEELGHLRWFDDQTILVDSQNDLASVESDLKSLNFKYMVVNLSGSSFTSEKISATENQLTDSSSKKNKSDATEILLEGEKIYEISNQPTFRTTIKSSNRF